MKIKVVCLSDDKALAPCLGDLAEFDLDHGTREDAATLLRNHHPDVVVLDIREYHGALALVEALRRWQTGVRILLIVDDQEDDQVLLRLLFAGVMGYVNHSHVPTRLRAAVLAVQQDQAWVPRQAVTHFIDTIAALDHNRSMH